MIHDLKRTTIDWTSFEQAARLSMEIIQSLANNRPALRSLVLSVADDERLLSMCEVHQHDEVAEELDSAADDRRVQYLVLHDALDRGIRIARRRSFPSDLRNWFTERDRIYRTIMEQCWNESSRAFVQFPGSDSVSPVVTSFKPTAAAISPA